MAKPKEFPAQKQNKQPGKQSKMQPKPELIQKNYKGSGKLEGRIALITGGDSGIGRSVAVHFAREGANVAIVYFDEVNDAEQTKKLVEKEQRECYLLQGDITDKSFCVSVPKKVMEKYGKLDIMVNNAAVQFAHKNLENINDDELERTFQTNIISMIRMTKEALKYLKKGAKIINTTSITAYRGSGHLIDYSATKGAITSFTRSLSKSLAKKGIYVNAVAPGPIWTPLIPATLEGIDEFGQDTPMGRAGQPSELGPAYVFLASQDSSYVTGQVIHVNGGEIIGG